jgi:hypothetical protein
LPQRNHQSGSLPESCAAPRLAERLSIVGRGFHAADFNPPPAHIYHQHCCSVAIPVCNQLSCFESCKLTTLPLSLIHLAATSARELTSTSHSPGCLKTSPHCYYLLAAFYSQIAASMPAILLLSLAMTLHYSSELPLGSSRFYSSLTSAMFTLSYPTSTCQRFESDNT